MMQLRSINLILVCFLLGACQTIPSLKDEARITNENFPQISFNLVRPSTELQNECQNHAAESVFKGCIYYPVPEHAFITAIQDSGVFAAVESGRRQEYKINLSMISKLSEDAESIANATLSGLSLMLIPYEERSEVTATIEVFWHDLLLKSYNYQLPYNKSIAIYKQPALDNRVTEDQQIFANDLVRKLIGDFEKDQVFSTQMISQTLRASNYEQSLTAPDSLGEYKLVNRYTYRSPFLGSMLRYSNPAYNDDIIDVFVYPIKATAWDDQPTTLQVGLDTVRKELELASKQGFIDAIDLSEFQQIRWTQNQIDYTGLYFDGQISYKDSQPQPSSAFLFIAKDKFVKIRAKTPADFAKPLVKKLMEAIEVPDESVFMAEIRQTERNKQFN